MTAAQVPGRLDEDHLQCRPDHRFDQVAAVRRPVRLADDHMGVQLRLALLVPGYVADQGKDLHLLAKRDAPVVLLLPVEVAEHDFAERPDRGEMATGQPILPRKRLQGLDDLVARTEDERERLLGLFV